MLVNLALILYKIIRRNRLFSKKNIGTFKVLSGSEDMLLVHSITQVSDSGFPLDRKDVNKLLLSYLNSKDVDSWLFQILVFKDNIFEYKDLKNVIHSYLEKKTF